MKILVAGWDSGGGVEVVEAIVRRAVARGHVVRMLGTECLRSKFEGDGATFIRYRYAPDNDTRSAESDLVKDWESSNPLTMFKRVRDRLMCGPARDFCRDVAEELAREPADLVLVDTMIPAAMFGAEAAGVRSAIVMHGLCMIPRGDSPAFGSGFKPARGGLGRLRDRLAAAATLAIFSSGMTVLNQARAEVGLPPARDLPDLISRVDRVLVCSSPSYDFGSANVPSNVSYVGPVLELDAERSFSQPVAGPADWPLVLVGLSSTVMKQEGLLQRAADALGQLPVRGLITTGPAVDPASISAPANVTVTRWARHADVLPQCAAAITHGGHGTVMKALTAGVPLVVVPLGRDQPDNAARVAYLGAGIRLPKNASTDKLRKALSEVLGDASYKAAAVATADRLRIERNDDKVIDELEFAAGLRRLVG